MCAAGMIGLASFVSGLTMTGSYAAGGVVGQIIPRASSHLVPVIPVNFHTNSYNTIIPESGYSQYYGGYWNESNAFVNSNPFMQLVYEVTPGDRIRIRGNSRWIMPLVLFFSDSNLTDKVADGTHLGTINLTYYDFEETVPFEANYVAVQQYRAIECKQPFLEIVKNVSDKVYKPKKLVLWGDSFTGMQGYADELMKRVKVVAPEYDIFNCGIGGEKTLEILARQSATAMFISPINELLSTDVNTGKKYITLPRGTDKVQIGTMNASGILSGWDNATHLRLLLQNTVSTDCEVNPVFIDGIKCELTYDIYGTKNYYLNRVEASASSKKIYVGENVMPNSATLVDGDINIINIGANGGFTSNKILIDQYKSMVGKLKNNKYIILSNHYSQNTDPSAANFIDDVKARELILRKAFGSKYINMREYFCTKAVYDGIEMGVFNGSIYPTNTDIRYMSQGLYAPCYWPNPNNGSDIIHMSRATYKVYNTYIFKRMIDLGYFSE